ncbi:MAG: ABC transporter ATP-binding protein [Dehalococcoidia bacterium]|nr:ABC transporter ATP-binding protein [Dehalococcoidia bacterium]
MPAIRCENLTKQYGPVVALDHLSLEVPTHSVFGFLGPNGAGKTTAVRLFMGLAQPSSGQAWIDGVAVGMPKLKERAGYLPDVPAFYGWMTGREYLLFTADLFRLSSTVARERADELLALVGLAGAAKRKVGGYSRGMRQRLGIAQALVNRPRVLFLDEPVSALDPIGRRDVLELILRLKDETTVFMSTHILSDVERVCDTVGIINKGKLVTVSSVIQLQARYAPSVFEIELEDDPARLISAIEPQPWVIRAEKVADTQMPVLRVQVKDVSTAKKALPQIIATSGAALLRYELVMPSLEDIFLELVGGAA